MNHLFQWGGAARGAVRSAVSVFAQRVFGAHKRDGSVGLGGDVLALSGALSRALSGAFSAALSTLLLLAGLMGLWGLRGLNRSGAVVRGKGRGR